MKHYANEPPRTSSAPSAAVQQVRSPDRGTAQVVGRTVAVDPRVGADDGRELREYGQAVHRVQRVRWLWLPLAIFASSRVITSIFMSWAGRSQIGTGRLQGSDPLRGYFVYAPQPPDPGLLGLATNWDGQWYELIATEGYTPASTDASVVQVHAWNFPPLYPSFVGGLMDVTGWDFALSSVVASLVLGAVAMVLLYRLAEPRLGAVGAAGLVALTACFVSAPLYQAAYSESAALLLIAWNLLCLRSRRYWWALLPLVLLSMTRLITPPLAVVALVLLWRRRKEPGALRPWEVAALITYVIVSMAGVWLWSTLSLALGGPAGSGRAGTMVQGFHWGWFGDFASVSPWLLLLPLTLAMLLTRIAWSEWRNWGPEMSAWAAAYPVYVLTVTPFVTGFIRYYMLAFPLSLALVGNKTVSSRRRILTITIGCLISLVLQLLWIRYSFVVDPDPNRPTITP